MAAKKVPGKLARQKAGNRAKPCQEPPSFAFRAVRTRLLAALLDNVAAWPKVLSIVAPIGYGKTVLMAALHTQLKLAGDNVVWLGLDDRNTSLESVLEAIEVGLDGEASAASFPPVLLPDYESAENRLESLLDRLHQLPNKTTLFIDNLNSCTAPNLGTLLDALIFRAPTTFRCVWSSSVRLPFNYARARLQGLVQQIGFADLCLNDQEAQQLLGEDLAGRIGSPGVDVLLQQTEGWPAALRMAQIILAETDQPLLALERFSGSDEDISALLNRHILEAFSPELKRFTLNLSALRIFSVELAKEATGDLDAADHIDFLLRKNVFIIPLDRQRKWYRLHGLFQAYLKDEATRQLGPKPRLETLARAARWCEREGSFRDAIEYALAGEPLEIASRVLEMTATTFVRDRGDIQQYIRWIDALLLKSVQIGWEASYWYVWALIFSRRYDYGRQQHQRLAERMSAAAGEGHAPPGDLPQRMAHLRICIGLFTDDQRDVLERAERWLNSETTEDPFNVGSICCMKSICLSSDFRFADARQTMRIADPILQQVQSIYSTGWANLIHATLLVYQGDYRNAYDKLTASLALIRGELGDEAGICGTTALVTAQCAVEMGLDDEALEYLRLGVRTVRSHGLVDTAASGFDAAVKLWSGADDETVGIPVLREIASGYPARLSWMLSCYLIRRLLCLGRLADAQTEYEWLNLEGMDAGAKNIARFSDLLCATEIDLAIASGDLKKARRLVDEASASSEGRIARQVELMLARAAIEMRLDNPHQARREVALAVSKAARRRIVRPFLDSSDVIAELLNQSKPSAWSFPIGEESTFFDEICQLPPIAGRLEQSRPKARHFDPGVSELPTKREIGVLTLMDQGLSNQQMADHEHVSVTTIKWHLQNIYRKLGVSNRAAALARARTLGLLPK